MLYTKILLLLFSLFFTLGGVSQAQVSLVDVEKVTESVGRIQSPATYTAPTGYDDKGFVGTILAKIFNPIGKIYSDYIGAFQNILSSNNTVPVWNATTKVFDPTNINYVGGLVGIAETNPEVRLHVNGVGRFDSGIQVDGNTIVTPSGNGVAAHSPDTNRYGFFKVWNANGQEGAYFGYGNGNDRVDLALRGNANKLVITGGNVGIGVSNPSNALQVSGNISASQNISANRFCNVSGTNCFTSPITCSGSDKALGWNGTNWVCNTITTGSSSSSSSGGSSTSSSSTSSSGGSTSSSSSSGGSSTSSSSTSSSGGSTSSSSGGSTTGPWTTGAWSSCSVTCGGGTQSRSVTCNYDNCTGSKPSSSMSCNTGSCNIPTKIALNCNPPQDTAAQRTVKGWYDTAWRCVDMPGFNFWVGVYEANPSTAWTDWYEGRKGNCGAYFAAINPKACNDYILCESGYEYINNTTSCRPK